MGYYEGEISGLGCNNNNMGSSWEGLIGLVLVAGLLGNGNFGGLFGGGRNGNGVADFTGWQLGRLATTNDVASGFSTSEIMSDLNTIINAQTQGFAGLNSAIANSTSTLGYNMLQGFNGIENSICTLGYQNAQLVNGLSRELAECCCSTGRAIDSLKFENCQNTSAIINAGNANTRAILDFLTSEKISALQAENSGLKAQISNDRQSAYLLNELKPCPVPAYLTCNPNAPYGFGYGVGFGLNTTGCCGASVQ